jgi:hypothetical protein
MLLGSIRVKENRTCSQMSCLFMLFVNRSVLLFAATMEVLVTPEIICFKSDGGVPQRIFTTLDGKIDFAVLGECFRLEPDSIKLCGTYFPRLDGKSDAPWKVIMHALCVEGSEQYPVTVSGDPKTGSEAPTGMFSLYSIFCHDHNYDSPKLLGFGLSSSLLLCSWTPLFH